MCAILICRVCRLVSVLWLFVVTTLQLKCLVLILNEQKHPCHLRYGHIPYHITVYYSNWNFKAVTVIKLKYACAVLINLGWGFGTHAETLLYIYTSFYVMDAIYIGKGLTDVVSEWDNTVECLLFGSRGNLIKKCTFVYVNICIY